MEEVTQKMASAQIKDVQAQMKSSQKKAKKGMHIFLNFHSLFLLEHLKTFSLQFFLYLSWVIEYLIGASEGSKKSEGGAKELNPRPKYIDDREQLFLRLKEESDEIMKSKRKLINIIY